MSPTLTHVTLFKWSIDDTGFHKDPVDKINETFRILVGGKIFLIVTGVWSIVEAWQ
jgi:hypothetical protein